VTAPDLPITCTNLSPPEVQQHTITRKPHSGLQSAQELQIRVSDGGNRVWLLPVKKCNTWLVYHPGNLVGIGTKSF